MLPTAALNATSPVPVPDFTVNVCAPLIVPSNVTSPDPVPATLIDTVAPSAIFPPDVLPNAMFDPVVTSILAPFRLTVAASATVNPVSGVVAPIVLPIVIVPVPFAVRVKLCAPSTAPPIVILPLVVVVNDLAPVVRETCPVPVSMAPTVVISNPIVSGDAFDTVKLVSGVVPPTMPPKAIVPVPAVITSACAPSIVEPKVTLAFDVVNVESPFIVIAPVPKLMPPVVEIFAPSVIGVALEIVKLVRGVVPPTAAFIASVPVPAVIVNACAPSIVPSNVTFPFVVVNAIEVVARVIGPTPKSIAPTVVIPAFNVRADECVSVRLAKAAVPPSAPPNVITPDPQEIANAKFPSTVDPSVTAPFVVVVRVDAPVMVTAPFRVIAPVVVVIDAPSDIAVLALETLKLVSGVIPPTAALIAVVPVPLLTVNACAPLIVPPSVTSPFVLDVRVLAPPDRVTAPVPKLISPVVVMSAPSVIGVALEIVKLVSGVVPPTSAFIASVPVPAVIVNTCAPLIVPSNVTFPFVVVRTIGPESNVIAPVPKSIAPTVVIDAFSVRDDE